MQATILTENDLSLTSPAIEKMAELFNQIEDNIEGIRVFATPGGCSGVSFGMTFTDQLDAEDNVRDYDQFKVIVDSTTLEQMRGVEIDFVGEGNEARFIFNNLQPVAGGGCGTCGSQGGCS
jgi:iron-sulfur cluster insertion protein